MLLPGCLQLPLRRAACLLCDVRRLLVRVYSWTLGSLAMHAFITALPPRTASARHTCATGLRAMLAGRGPLKNVWAGASTSAPHAMLSRTVSLPQAEVPQPQPTLTSHRSPHLLPIADLRTAGAPARYVCVCVSIPHAYPHLNVMLEPRVHPGKCPLSPAVCMVCWLVICPRCVSSCVGRARTMLTWQQCCPSCTFRGVAPRTTGPGTATLHHAHGCAPHVRGATAHCPATPAH